MKLLRVGQNIQVEEDRTGFLRTLVEETETCVDVDSSNSSHVLVTGSFIKKSACRFGSQICWRNLPGTVIVV